MKSSLRLLIWTAAALLVLPTVVAQTVPPPQPANSEDSSRHSPSPDSDMSTAAEHRPKVGREARMGGISAGSIVQSPAGENIGRVKDIVPDAKTGDPAYIVIATRAGSTAVPYAIVAPMYQNGHVVIDRSRLESAPRVSDTQLRNDEQGAQWKKEANGYWEARHPPNLE